MVTFSARNCDVCSSSLACDVLLDSCHSCLNGDALPPSLHLDMETIIKRFKGGRCDLCLGKHEFVSRQMLFVCLQCELSTPKDDSILFLRQLASSPLTKHFQGDASFMLNDETEPIQAHRFVLVSKSSVFRTMFEVDISEKSSETVHIEGISPAVLRAALHFMYAAEIKFTNEVSPLAMLMFADKYDIPFLKDECDKRLAVTVTEKNLLELLSISYWFGAEKLKTKATKFFTEHSEFHGKLLESLFEKRVDCLGSGPD